MTGDAMISFWPFRVICRLHYGLVRAGDWRLETSDFNLLLARFLRMSVVAFKFKVVATLSREFELFKMVSLSVEDIFKFEPKVHSNLSTSEN